MSHKFSDGSGHHRNFRYLRYGRNMYLLVSRIDVFAFSYVILESTECWTFNSYLNALTFLDQWRYTYGDYKKCRQIQFIFICWIIRNIVETSRFKSMPRHGISKYNHIKFSPRRPNDNWIRATREYRDTRASYRSFSSSAFDSPFYGLCWRRIHAIGCVPSAQLGSARYNRGDPKPLRKPP